LQANHNPADAERHYQQACAIYEAVHGERHAQVAGCQRDLAEVCSSQERYAEAEEHFRRALAVRAPHGASVVLEIVEALHCLSRVLAAQGQFDEAERVAGRAVALSGGEEVGPASRAGPEEVPRAERHLPAEGEPQLLAASLDALARLYQAQGR